MRLYNSIQFCEHGQTTAHVIPSVAATFEFGTRELLLKCLPLVQPPREDLEVVYVVT